MALTLGNAFQKLFSEIDNENIVLVNNVEEASLLANNLAKILGEGGRSRFMRIIEISGLYAAIDASQHYEMVLMNIKEVKEDYFIDLAIRAKIQGSKSLKLLVKEPEPLDEILFKRLPPFLTRVLAKARSVDEKTLALLGALTVLSSVLPGLHGYYDGSRFYPNLYLFISGPAAIGKGFLKFIKLITQPIHDGLRLKTKQQRIIENTSKGTEGSSKGNYLSKVPEYMLYIPANSSSTGFIELLHQNDSSGLIFETEADTLTQILRTDYGDYSNALRQAWSHEAISYYRRGDKELVDMDNPKISILLTGTPKQVQRFFPSAENGLFSRFLFFILNMKIDWRDPFAAGNSGEMEDHYQNLGKEFQSFYNLLLSRSELAFTFTDAQKRRFNDHFRGLQGSFVEVYGFGSVSTFRRIAATCFRIAMVLSAIRAMDDGLPDHELICTDEDFEVSLEISSCLLLYASEVFMSLPKEKIQHHDPKVKGTSILEGLSEVFDTNQFKSQAKEMGYNPRTVERYLKPLVQKGIIKKLGQGSYKKLDSAA